ncbi:phospholipase A1-like [Megachile rotundata]|uniref:phospholipase A1-like n=1 Tax=Megachile rotundata TaxID=143995 RepID=UPI000258D898|nr:PREDICTED: phospholipase A1-like [Megachile rotundata]
MNLYLINTVIGFINQSRFINEARLDAAIKIEANMKMPAPIGFLFLSSVVGVLVLSNTVGAAVKTDLYMLDDNDVPVKVDLTETSFEPNVNVNDLPKRVLFYLYTKNTKKNAEQLHVGDSNSLAKSHFNPKKPTKFVTHGWISSQKSKACTLVRDAFLQNGDYNVIVVDWSSISRRPYLWTSRQVVSIAQFVGKMIDFLESHGMKPSDVTVVGHSLGAHIAGLSSYYAKNKVNYVVGLDPAGPNYNLNGEGSRISAKDAKYVEIIHTSILLGLNKQLGHSDFYPNGGSTQNGCSVDLGGSCSHARSYRFFAESINSNGFLARSCSGYSDYKGGKCNSNHVARMGGVQPDTKASGKYYLTTNSKSPYAKNVAFELD